MAIKVKRRKEEKKFFWSALGCRAKSRLDFEPEYVYYVILCLIVKDPDSKNDVDYHFCPYRCYSYDEVSYHARKSIVALTQQGIIDTDSEALDVEVARLFMIVKSHMKAHSIDLPQEEKPYSIRLSNKDVHNFLQQAWKL